MPEEGLPLPEYDTDDLDWSVLLSDHDSSEDLSPSPLMGARVTSKPHREDSRARRRELRATSARRRRAQSKNELSALCAEVGVLEDCLALLRRQHVVTDGYELALEQQRKRKRAEAENTQLKLALAGVRSNVHDLSAFLSIGFLNTGVNMRDLLHSYTHLSKDPRAREREYLAMCSQRKLDTAFQIVTRESSKIRPTGQPLHIQPVPSRPDELAITMCAELVLETTDVAKAFLACGKAYLACNIGWASFRQLQTTPRTMEIPTRDIRYTVSEAHYSSESTGEIVLFEESSLTYWKLTPARGVLIWDFVDVDDLYPFKQSADARRHNTAAMIVRRELCADSVERVICSIVCTKTFHFLPQGKPIVALETVSSASTIMLDMKSASQIVHQAILENMLYLPDGTGFD